MTATTLAAPTSTERLAAHASALSATLGFVPLHLVWALGIPLFADEQRFRVWHEDGGLLYLMTLNAMAVLPAVLAFAMVRPWGLRLPRRAVVAAGYGVSGFLFLYTVYAVALGIVLVGSDEAIFSPWTLAYGVPQFLVWATGLWIATSGYARRTASVPSRAQAGQDDVHQPVGVLARG